MYFPVSALLIEFMILSIVNREDSYGYGNQPDDQTGCRHQRVDTVPDPKKLEKAGYVTTYSAEVPGAENGSIIRSQKQEKHRWRTCRAKWEVLS